MHLLSETTQEANAALAANNQPPSSAEGVVGGATSAGVAAEGSTSDVRIEDITESQDNHADLEETEPLEALEPELEQQAEVRASSPLLYYVHTKLQKILVRLWEGRGVGSFSTNYALTAISYIISRSSEITQCKRL